MHRFRGRGVYILDEPESALSPQRQLAVLSRIHDLVRQDSQFLIATHSPILMAYPDACIYQYSADSISASPTRRPSTFRSRAISFPIPGECYRSSCIATPRNDPPPHLMKLAAIFLLILLSGVHASGAEGFTFPLEGIDHWVVYYFPERISTRVGLSPEQLRQRAYYTLIIRDRADPRLRDILASIAQTRASKQKYGFDARWGIDLFYKAPTSPYRSHSPSAAL